MTTSNKDRTKNLFRNASWLFGAKTAAGIFSALQTVIIARMAGAAEYGLLVLIIAYVGILYVICSFQFWETVVKYVGSFWEEGDKQRTAAMIKASYIVDTSSGFVAFLISILTAGLMNEYFIKSPGAELLIKLFSISLLIDTTNYTSDAILRVFNKYKSISFVLSITNLFRLILVAIALYMKLGLQEIIYAYIAASVVGICTRIFIVNTTLRQNGMADWWSSDLSLIKDSWKGITWFIANSSIAKTLTLASDNYLGVMILGYFAGNEATGLYKVARNCTTIIKRFMDPVYEAIYPDLVNISQLNKIDEFWDFIKSSTKTLVMVSTPVAIVLMLFAEFIISLIFGDEYLPAADALRVVTIAIMISQLSFWNSPALLALGRPGLRTVIRACTTVVYLGALFTLVPRYSYNGAAFSFLTYATIVTIVCFVNIKYLIGHISKQKP